MKLNIEMSMAHLIKKIAMDRSRNSDIFIAPSSRTSAFKCCTQDSDSLPPSRQTLSMLKSVFSRDQPSPPLARNTITKTEEFRVQSGPIRDLEMQQSGHRNEHEIYDGSSFISGNGSLAWADVDESRSKREEEQDTLSIRNVHTCSSVNDEAHLIRLGPAVLCPT